MTTEPKRDETDDPGSDGVVGEQPNRTDPAGSAPLDEAPDGQTPADVTESSEDSLPPG